MSSSLKLRFLDVEVVLDKGGLGPLDREPQLRGHEGEARSGARDEEGHFAAGDGGGGVVNCREFGVRRSRASAKRVAFELERR